MYLNDRPYWQEPESLVDQIMEYRYFLTGLPKEQKEDLRSRR
jgi:hypothetical protein